MAPRRRSRSLFSTDACDESRAGRAGSSRSAAQTRWRVSEVSPLTISPVRVPVISVRPRTESITRSPCTTDRSRPLSRTRGGSSAGPVTSSSSSPFSAAKPATRACRRQRRRRTSAATRYAIAPGTTNMTAADASPISAPSTSPRTSITTAMTRTTPENRPPTHSAIVRGAGEAPSTASRQRDPYLPSAASRCTRVVSARVGRRRSAP